MHKRTKQLKFLRLIILAVCLIGSVFLVRSSFFYTNAPVKAANKTDLQPGQIKLSKTAEPVAGMVNQWDVTLRVEGRNQFPPPPTDVVLIIDISGSMSFNDRMVKAKVAAEKFVNMVLKKDYVNRVALITFSSNVTKYTFNENGWSGQFVDYTHKDLLTNKIKELNYIDNSGTFTQAAIKTATEVMTNATGEKRNIVLISDGVPTFSYPPTKPYNQLSGMQLFDYPSGDARYNYYETVKTIPKGYFNYNKEVGNGYSYRYEAAYPDYEQMPPGSPNRLMMNHANSAIAEANIMKKEKLASGEQLVTDLYTIGVDLDLVSQDDEIITGNQTLREIASSEEKCFAATADNLEDILSGIAGEIVGAIKSATVVDPMGTGFSLEGEVNPSQGSTDIKRVSGTDTINWTVGALKTPVSNDPDEDVMYAEITYRVNATDKVLAANIIDINGLAATNGRTTIVYKDYNDAVKRAEFDVPKVKPIIVTLKKKLLAEDGTEITDKSEQFHFKYGDDVYTANDSFVLYATEEKKIVHPFKADQEYTVEELLAAPEKYETKIDINGQVTADSKAVFTFDSSKAYQHQQILVTNTKIAEVKKVQLNIRQSVIQPNEELVIPSKGYYTAFISGQEQTRSFVSGSTVKDTAAEVSQALFTTYELTIKREQSQLKVTDLVPEYYTFLGYILTSTDKELNTTHLSSNSDQLIQTNEAVLDYQLNNEYWLTMFITPDLGTDTNNEQVRSPRPYSWSYKINQFGQ
ncbi:VWA domain-containing protein [Erwinia sp. CPCC 100877]|nr:VWA domain-containing protein [Erwinia sp. CPCC 100877]